MTRRDLERQGLNYMPSELGYGNSPRPGGAIKPGDSLIFECELLEIDPG